jgi:protein AaeX
MGRELAVFGILIPTLLPLFVACLALQMALDRLLGRLGLYRRVWHPSLVRLSLFVAIFCAAQAALGRLALT